MAVEVPFQIRLSTTITNLLHARVIVCIICSFELEFYDTVNFVEVMLSLSVNLFTLFLGRPKKSVKRLTDKLNMTSTKLSFKRLTSTCAYTFAEN